MLQNDVYPYFLLDSMFLAFTPKIRHQEHLHKLHTVSGPQIPWYVISYHNFSDLKKILSIVSMMGS